MAEDPGAKLRAIARGLGVKPKVFGPKLKLVRNGSNYIDAYSWEPFVPLYPEGNIQLRPLP